MRKERVSEREFFSYLFRFTLLGYLGDMGNIMNFFFFF